MVDQVWEEIRHGNLTKYYIIDSLYTNNVSRDSIYLRKLLRTKAWGLINMREVHNGLKLLDSMGGLIGKNDYQNRSLLYSDYAVLFVRNRKWETVDSLMREAINHAWQMHDTLNAASYVNNLAISFLGRNNPKDAKRVIRPFMNYGFNYPQESKAYARLLYQLATAHLDLNEIDSATYFYKLSLDHEKLHPITPRGGPEAYLRLAETQLKRYEFLDISQKQQISNWLDSAEVLCLLKQDDYVLQFVYKQKGHYYALNGQPQKSVEAYSKAFELQEALFDIENANLLNELETKLKLSERNKRIQQAQLIIKSRENRIKWLILGCLFLLIVSILLTLLIAQRKKLHNAQLTKQQQSNDLEILEALSRGEEIERQRLSEELHDGLGSSIGALHLQFSALKVKPEVLAELERIGQDVRNISHDLMPIALSQGNLVASFIDLKRHFLNSNMTFHLHQNGQLTSTGSQQKDLNLFRIVQEWTRNTLKHSGGTEVHLSLWEEPNEWVLQFEDNGIGLHNDVTKPGLGLQNIEKRAQRIGAKLHVHKNLKGFRSELRVPINRST